MKTAHPLIPRHPWWLRWQIAVMRFLFSRCEQVPVFRAICLDLSYDSRDACFDFLARQYLTRHGWNQVDTMHGKRWRRMDLGVTHTVYMYRALERTIGVLPEEVPPGKPAPTAVPVAS